MTFDYARYYLRGVCKYGIQLSPLTSEVLIETAEMFENGKVAVCVHTTLSNVSIGLGISILLFFVQ